MTIAAAIGATTLVASAVNAVLLHPLPVSNLDRLVTIGRQSALAGDHGRLQAGEVFSLEARRDLFDALAGYRPLNLNLTGSREPQHIAGVTTTGEFFDVFGTPPFLGRFYSRNDEQTGATSVVVLSYALWRELTGGDARAIGRTLRLNDSTYTIIGIAQPRFEYPLGAQLWTPKPLDYYLNRGASDRLLYAGAVVPTVARMRPGVTVPHLETELAAAVRAWESEKPQFYANRARRPLEARAFVTAWSGALRSVLFILVGAVALVLAIASANVGSLLLLRTTGRAREIAVRMAFGASRVAVARQFGFEILVLVGSGGLLGILFADRLIVALRSFLAQRSPELGAMHLDLFVLGCVSGVMVLTAAASSLGPLFRLVSADPRDVLGATSSRGLSDGVGRSRFLRGAVILQIAIALMLSLGCTVAFRSAVRLLAVSPGFDPKNVVAARMALPSSAFADTTLAGAIRSLAFHERFLAELRSSKDVEAASTVDVAPFGFGGALDAAMHRTQVTAEITGGDTRNAFSADDWDVDADYFRLMRIPFLAGRGFTGHEQQDQVRAYPKQLQIDVVIDEALARRLFPGQNAVGRLIGPWAPGLRVIGVVGSVKQSDLTAPESGAIYYGVAATQNQQMILVRTALPIHAAAALIRDAAHQADPQLAVFDFQSLGALVSRSAAPREMVSWLLGAFAVLALCLALLGVYAVLNYATAQRAKELAIRLALGAQPRDLLAGVVRAAGTVTAIGLGAGGFGYLILRRGLAAVAYGVEPADALALGSIVLFVAATTLLASLPPAIRASRVDPSESLKAN